MPHCFVRHTPEFVCSLVSDGQTSRGTRVGKDESQAASAVGGLSKEFEPKTRRCNMLTKP